MNFSKKSLSNKAFSDSPLAFNPQVGERLQAGDYLDVPPAKTGAIVKENGDVLFRVYAPTAKTVEVDVKIASEMPNIILQKNDTGMFEGILPYDPSLCGPKSIDFIIDGVTVVYPYAPIFFWNTRASNYVDIPDPETDYILINDVPHGTVSREIYFSKAMKDWEQCLVYTPSGYQKGGEYPVLYLQHGAYENETTWVYNGKLPYILDNLLSKKKCEPFIVVMNDGMVRKESESIFCFEGFSEMLLEDCMPFIESKYRVKPGKWNRAMAGLSMGSMQTSFAGLAHPELFGYLGLFSGFMLNITDRNASHENTGYLAIIRENQNQFAKEFKLFFRAIGDADVNFSYFKADDAFCKQTGIDKLPNYVRKTYPGIRHDWAAWRRAIYDFSQLIFK